MLKWKPRKEKKIQIIAQLESLRDLDEEYSHFNGLQNEFNFIKQLKRQIQDLILEI
jgi:hypothetical protein